MVGLVVVATSCVTPPAGSGPGDGPHLVSVRFEGAYHYDTAGPVVAGSLQIGRSGGTVTSVRGEVQIPGRGEDRARVRFDVQVDGPLASGSIAVVDPAAGIEVSTPLVAAPVTVSAGAVGGTVEWTRLWRILELRPYRLRWEVRDGTGSVPDAPPLPTDASGTFSAITYNVAGLIEPISGSKPASYSASMGSRLDAYDLALLQEDFFYRDLVIRDATFPYGSEPEPIVWGSDPSRGTAIVRSGLEQYSRMPFDGYEHHTWPGCYGLLPTDGGASDCLSLKGWAVSRLHLAEGTSIDVYNLHAEAGSTPNDLVWSARDYEVLAEFIATRSAGRAILLGGDTNLSQSNPVDIEVWERFLAETGLRDACDDTPCTVDPTTIDRFAVRSGDDVELTITAWERPKDTFSAPGGDGLSDHDPSVVRVAWQRR